MDFICPRVLLLETRAVEKGKTFAGSGTDAFLWIGEDFATARPSYLYRSRVLSMTFGRPSMISRTTAERVPYPLIVYDEYLNDDDQTMVAQPANTLSKMGFLVKS